jgi:precorrin-2 dehydrogenase/sirohydrochlorin ferrochelatase
VSAFGFPVLLDLRERRAVVIGEVPVREGKVEGLLAGGAAEVTVVALEPAAHLEELAALEGVRVERRTWRPDDLQGAAVAIAHDPDPEVRDAIAGEARARGVLVNVVDDVANCDWAMPAIVRRGQLLIAIGTGGASPALARKVAERLRAEFGPEWAEVVRIVREVRAETMPKMPVFAERARRWREALDPDEAVSLVREGRGDELRARLTARLREGVTSR